MVVSKWVGLTKGNYKLKPSPYLTPFDNRSSNAMHQTCTTWVDLIKRIDACLLTVVGNL